ncbi:unnamed protein product [Staurois parvus]|uniref:Uncharacterized protein n=1 Tax=Staurois parvus TaxID=386267 RepID=A0ABN9GAY2_9NEOB|nr:unnamed protein product [Staurois parvus]CAI9572149.1 unnamed protein product [Staurois parvus]CAI9600395.1 unnamed protein product [Staurois parvus]CAI9606565.1 unnamed protein product [Staurois parvus]
MVGVTGQVQQVASSVVQRVKQRDGQESDRNREQEQDTGPRETQHQGRVCGSGHPLNTPASSVTGVSWLQS